MSFLYSFWDYILISAPYLMLGLFLSGLIHQFIPLERVKKLLGKGQKAAVLKASLIGVPMPLCSCSVIPTAVTLKKSGASHGATSAFLISTPESGVDSIMMTYALMDLPMAIMRPIAAFLSAMLAGFGQRFNDFVATAEEEAPACCAKKAIAENIPLFTRLKAALIYGFDDLLKDMAFWLTFGLVVGALIQVVVPNDFFLSLGPIWGRVAVLFVGIPLYICASASTPIAVSLVLKGMSPGTALIFLLVGPATNISNLFVLQKYIGKKGIFINIAAVVIVALGMSWVTDMIYQSVAINWKMEDGHYHQYVGMPSQVLAVAFVMLLLRALYLEEIKPRFNKKQRGACH